MMIFWTWSSLMMMVRVWAKVNVKRWGSDDYFVAAAFVSASSTALCTISDLPYLVTAGD